MFYVIVNGHYMAHDFSYLGTNKIVRVDPTLPQSLKKSKVHPDEINNIKDHNKKKFAIEIMTTSPFYCLPNAKIKILCEQMKSEHFHHIPVIKARKIMGMISDRDMKDFAQSGAYHFLMAKDIMSNVVVAAHEDATISDLGQVMIKENISAFPIINSNLDLVGIVTKTNLLKFFSV